ncbi:MAG: maltose alpha-D-glucosyltransferase [Geminicoccaceae bacterium]|nr:maltose alpha-D-glucosyltransferase [Geminicoccaceae bacterium]
MADDPLWFKDAIIYQTHIKAFFDSNNDGIGDFAGLIEKLDYVKDLGASTIWLLPFYPSPLRDDGYDIQDYRSINPAYGSMRDVRRLVKEAHKRGLRVVTELVINHTSDQHPWFQRARKAKPGSKYRNYYVWSDTDQKYKDTRIIFLDTETSNWTWDPVAKAYFWHRFYSHQPDLNFDNPAVMKEVLDLLHYWLDMGIDGLRLDAIPYLIEREGTNCENLPETHDVLKRIRKEMDDHYPDRMLLAEANQWPEDTRPYFGEGDECHMAFHFPLMPRMYLAVAREDRYPITDIMRQTPEIPANCQWAIFLRNHDELTLEMVTENERDYLWNTYAADRRMRINLGIRRRLAPLMDNDRRKIELLNSMLLSMPGTPVIYYGDEIGMGDNVFLGDRDGVRTPMQWSLDRNAGFSRANPQQLYLPAVMDPVFGYQAVNVEAQTRNPSSLLNWMRRLITTRRAHRAFGRGTLTFLYPGNRKILAYIREHEDEAILCVVNLSRHSQPVELDLSRFKERVPIELLGHTAFPPIGDLTYLLTLPGHGFYWFLLAEEAEVPSWHQSIPDVMPDLSTIVMGRQWGDLMQGRSRKDLEEQVLPGFAATQRWFAAKDVGVGRIAIGRWGEIPRDGATYLLTQLDIETKDGRHYDYLLPFDVAWGEEQIGAGSPLLPFTLAKARRGPRVGALHDATAGTGLAAAMLDAMRADLELEASEGRLVFKAGDKLEQVTVADDVEIRRLGVEQSNSSILMGDALIMKLYRRLQSGIHPEIEIARFLTDVAHFENTPPLLGSLEWFDADGGHTALAAAYGFVRNQGDGWEFTIDYLTREVERILLASVVEEGGTGTPHQEFSFYRAYAATLGRRTGEMHAALAVETDDPAFGTEPIAASDMKSWVDATRKQLTAAMKALERVLPNLEEAQAEAARSVLDAKAAVEARLKEIAGRKIDAAKTRLHGDYHLGQVVVVTDDFHILDFEGEPTRSIDERRAKMSPLKDVAGMLRSFDYAAWTIIDRLSHDHPAHAERLEAILGDWRRITVKAFLQNYLSAMQGVPSLPADRDEAEDLLELHLIEKALYEINYEAANRPRWLHIPLSGLAGLVEPASTKRRLLHGDD